MESERSDPGEHAPAANWALQLGPFCKARKKALAKPLNARPVTRASQSSSSRRQQPLAWLAWLAPLPFGACPSECALWMCWLAFQRRFILRRRCSFDQDATRRFRCTAAHLPSRLTVGPSTLVPGAYASTPLSCSTRASSSVSNFHSLLASVSTASGLMGVQPNGERSIRAKLGQQMVLAARDEMGRVARAHVEFFRFRASLLPRLLFSAEERGGVIFGACFFRSVHVDLIFILPVTPPRQTGRGTHTQPSNSPFLPTASKYGLQMSEMTKEPQHVLTLLARFAACPVAMCHSCDWSRVAGGQMTSMNIHSIPRPGPASCC